MNERGQPLDPAENVQKFINQCGVLARELPITIQEWHKPKTGDATYVDERRKEKLWEDLKINFTLPPEVDEEKLKAWALTKMADAFRAYKKRLYKVFVVEKKPLKFEGAYEKIKDQWADFVKYRTEDEKAIQRRATNKANAEKKTYHHNLGPSGYRANRPKWEKLEQDLVDRGITPETLPWEERSREWFFGHGGTLDLETGVAIYTKEQLAVPTQKLKEAVKEKLQGKFFPNREKDELTRALGNKEHPGRTRGTKGSVPWKEGFPRDLGTYRSRGRKKEEERTWKAQVEDTLVGLQEEVKTLRSQQSTGQSQRQPEEEPAFHDAPSSQRRSSVASTELAAEEQPARRYPVDDITGREICELYIKYANIDIKVAAGSVLPPVPGQTCHTVPVPAGYAIVWVDRVEKSFQNLALDYPTGEVQLLIDAERSTCLWKKDFIKLPQWNPPNPPPPQNNSPAPSPSRQPSPPPRTSPPPQSSPVREQSPTSQPPPHPQQSPPPTHRQQPLSPEQSSSPDHRQQPLAPEQSPSPPQPSKQGVKKRLFKSTRTTSTTSKSKKSTKSKKAKPAPEKRAYDMTDEELTVWVKDDIERQLYPKRFAPPPEPEIPLEKKIKLLKNSWQPGPRLASDYDRSIKKSHADPQKCISRGRQSHKTVPQLGEQEKQWVAPLIVPRDPQPEIAAEVDDALAAVYAQEAIKHRLSLPEYLARIQASHEFNAGDKAYNYEYGNCLVRPEEVKDLSTYMRHVHEWYMNACKNSEACLVVHVKDEDWFHGDDAINVDFSELFNLYNIRDLDKSILSSYCL